ncbi:MAG: MBL fold metallo-hydrolase [Thermoleophilia bacterium]|nr:MBL fold metallo-hydrolase [Thermoleophilia bacterium]
MAAEFTILGTGGWIPTTRRETTCAILSMPDLLFIFDAGTGLARLLEDRFRPLLELSPERTPDPAGEPSREPARTKSSASTPSREVHLFLSHYHLDHIAGLVYLPAMFKGRTVYLHPPAASITGYDPQEIISGIIRKPYNPQSIDDMPLDLIIKPLEEGEHVIAGADVRVRKQIHADPSVAYRIEDLLAFATDTADDPGTAEFARGVRLLAHEAWIDGIEEDDPATERIAREAYVAHTSARQAAARAAEAGVEKLALMHLNPLRGAEYHERMLVAAQKIFPGTVILEDGETVEL